MVQRSAARFVMNEYGRMASVSEMLNALQWHTLEKHQTVYQPYYCTKQLTIWLTSMLNSIKKHQL